MCYITTRLLVDVPDAALDVLVQWSRRISGALNYHKIQIRVSLQFGFINKTGFTIGNKMRFIVR
jgi:hypothetical protein